MLSNSYSRTWLGHTLGKLRGSTGQGWHRARGLCQPCLAEPGVGAMLPRAWGLCRGCLVCVCVCAGTALLHGPSPTSVRFARHFCRFQSAARSPGWESLSFHLKAATVWQRTISTLSVHKHRPRPAGLRLHSQTPLALKRNRFTPRGLWCFVKVLLGWLTTENSLENSLYIFLQTKTLLVLSYFII